MDVAFLNARDVASAIVKLVDEHDEFHWAVAWGAMHGPAEKALAHPSKFAAVTFGLSFAHTDPSLVKKLVDRRGARVVTAFPNGTFHPKIYAFRTGERVAAIVGSAKFTPGGLAKNSEAALMLTGLSSDPALADILEYCADSFALGEAVTLELAQRYALSCKKAARLPRVPRDPLAEIPASRVKGFQSRLAGMDWQQYATAIKRSEHHDVDDSLDLLRIAQSWFSAERSFKDFSTPQRKAIAGILGAGDREEGTELDRDWGWFGSMRGAGDFANRIAENDASLARAIDSIPLRGEVSRQHYERFTRHFEKAFTKSTRVGAVPTASRLLAMKRPDVFLCVCGPNRALAAAEMGFAPSGLRLDNYWDLVVEVVRASDWYNVEKPDGADGPLWECRVAMLDAIFYRP